jgi:MFS family permease
MGMLNTLSRDVIAHFNVSNTQLSDLASAFFYTNALFLIPAGIMLDHFSKRKIILIIFGLSLIGSVLFAFTNNWSIAVFARCLSGLGSGFSLLGCFRIVVDWFPENRRAQVMGLMVTIGLFGGVFAQTPLAFLVLKTSYHTALLWNIGLGLFLWMLMFLFLKDAQKILPAFKLSGLFSHLKKSALKLQNWGCGVYASLLNLCVTVIGALWGNLYLQHVRHFSLTEASWITSMVFFGIMLGAPVIGWISDVLQRRKSLMILGALLSCTTIMSIIYLPNVSLMSAMTLFFVLGFLSGVQVLAYPFVVESNPPELASSATSVIALSINLGAALMQLIFGILVDHSGYSVAMLALLIAAIISLLIALFLHNK